MCVFNVFVALALLPVARDAATTTLLRLTRLPRALEVSPQVQQHLRARRRALLRSRYSMGTGRVRLRSSSLTSSSVSGIRTRSSRNLYNRHKHPNRISSWATQVSRSSSIRRTGDSLKQLRKHL